MIELCRIATNPILDLETRYAALKLLRFKQTNRKRNLKYLLKGMMSI